jgi:hypothetical protein
MSDADKHKLSEFKRQGIFERLIKLDIFADAKSALRPRAVVFGGQPGAGKSAAVDAATTEFNDSNGVVVIIGDDLRAFHPEYDRLMSQDDSTAAFFTDRDTGAWIEMAIAFAIQNRMNMVVEGTMRDAGKVKATLSMLRQADYETDVRALAVNERLSWQGIMQRYEAQKRVRGFGRMTTRESHDAAYKGMVLTLTSIEQEKLADRISLFKRGNELVYENELVGGEWKNTPDVSNALKGERSRRWSKQEWKVFVEAYEDLEALLRRPERGASTEELRVIQGLLSKAQSERDNSLGLGQRR